MTFVWPRDASILATNTANYFFMFRSYENDCIDMDSPSIMMKSRMHTFTVVASSFRHRVASRRWPQYHIERINHKVIPICSISERRQFEIYRERVIVQTNGLRNLRKPGECMLNSIYHHCYARFKLKRAAPLFRIYTSLYTKYWRQKRANACIRTSLTTYEYAIMACHSVCVCMSDQSSAWWTSWIFAAILREPHKTFASPKQWSAQESLK